ncbi:unnamed protein product [Medioppia subpectinata]|uniref:Uncharacterized protein n=1 Tax=Medioppia subpectinata TaxID=1979941 RepID=A0A7R9KZB3_9ACAR|nr:unnamed protein product [Medioppia subpectinata]CAG2111466.1 unnamed protein product [Medioppia subpectinata]
METQTVSHDSQWEHLLSSGLVQRGADSEGIYGFLVEDIRKEHKRGERLRCSYCKNNGATIGCAIKSCKTMFHLPCGLKSQALCQFFDKFEYEELKSGIEAKNDCPICYTGLKFDEGVDVLATVCCDKLIHRLCIQKQALSAGYFFKCPLCNSGQEFKEMVQIQGIYVPKQDASWETEANRFDDLYRRHSRCDQEECFCPNGRNHSSDARNWQLLICDTCGSKGAHWQCIGRSNYVDVWNCDDCLQVEERIRQREEDYDNRAKQNSRANSSSNINPNLLSTTNSSANEKPLKRRQTTDTARRTAYQLSTNESIEINIDSGDDEPPAAQTPPPKRMRGSGLSVRRKPEMKDMAIQCELVSVDDLIDCDPIERLQPYVIKVSNPVIASGVTECIEIDGDSDEDIVIID